MLDRAAIDSYWVDRVPMIRMLPESKHRTRHLRPAEAWTPPAELGPHLADMAAFTLATRLRRSNVAGLTSQYVDLGREVAWNPPNQAKARKATPVALNADARNCIQRQSRWQPGFVFANPGKPVRQVNTKASRTALKRRNRQCPLARPSAAPGPAVPSTTARPQASPA